MLGYLSTVLPLILVILIPFTLSWQLVSSLYDLIYSLNVCFLLKIIQERVEPSCWYWLCFWISLNCHQDPNVLSLTEEECILLKMGVYFFGNYFYPKAVWTNIPKKYIKLISYEGNLRYLTLAILKAKLEVTNTRSWG